MSEQVNTSASIPVEAPKGVCQATGHCFVVMSGPYRKSDKDPRTGALRDNHEAEYYAVLCSKCGVVMEAAINLIAPPRRV